MADIRLNQFSFNKPKFLISRALNSLNNFDDFSIDKSLNGNVVIDVKENRLLFYEVQDKKTIFFDDKDNQLEFDKNITNRLKSSIPKLNKGKEFDEELEKKLVSQLNKLDDSVLLEISEITHNPLEFDKENFIFTMTSTKEIYIHANLDDLVTVGANYHSFAINTRYDCSIIQYINSENRAIVRTC
jgi:hypothetical protein